MCSQHPGCCGGACDVGNICEGTIHAKRHLKVLEQHMLTSRGRLFQDVSETMPNHIQRAQPQPGSVVEGCGCYTGLNALQTFHSLETFGALWGESDDKEGPKLLGKYKRKKLFPTLKRLVSSVPNTKRKKWCNAVVKMTFFRSMVPASNSE